MKVGLPALVLAIETEAGRLHPEYADVWKSPKGVSARRFF